MNTPLNDDIQRKARELAARITVAHDLDPEIQEELYGHIEDKLLAYCNGEEPVTPEDALILAREHFGDAKAIRGLLQEVHVEVVEAGLARKILALVIAGMGIGIVGKLALSVLGAGLVYVGMTRTLAGDAFLLLSIVEQWVVLLVLFCTLSRWKHREVCGTGVWYLRWSLPRMVMWATVLYVTAFAIPAVSIGREGGGAAGLQVISVFYLVTVLGLFVANCMLWLWWSGAAAAGTLRYTVNLGAWWVVFLVATMFQPARLSINFGTGEPVAFAVVSIANGSLGETPVAAYLTYLGPWRTWGELSLTAGFLGVLAMASCLIVVVWRSVWLRRNPRANQTDIS